MKDIKLAEASIAVRAGETGLLVPEFTTAGLLQPKNIHYLPKKEHVGSKTEKRGSDRR